MRQTLRRSIAVDTPASGVDGRLRGQANGSHSMGQRTHRARSLCAPSTVFFEVQTQSNLPMEVKVSFSGLLYTVPAVVTGPSQIVPAGSTTVTMKS